MNNFRKRLIYSIFSILFIIIFGTTGYMLIEGWRIDESLYMTIITISTVGYKEVHDLSYNGRIFTIILILCGVGTLLYILNNGAKILLEGELKEIYGRKRLEKRLKELKDHYIICGYGRMGKIIAKELSQEKLNIVVIEKNEEAINEDDNTFIIHGDATKDEVLKKVNIEKAKCLISVLPTDAENLYVVLSARSINPNLMIVARAGEEGSEKKLLSAGADRVVSPYHIGGLRIAHTVLRPAVVDFIELATKSGNIDLQIEEVTVKEDSSLNGLTLEECSIGRELGILIIAIKDKKGEMRFNPNFKTTISAGDTLIAVGEPSKLKLLEEMSSGNRS